jgi:hypothetical protein
MGPRKTGGKSASRPSAQKKAPNQNQSSGVPTWPRLDQLPREQVLGGLRDLGRIVLASRKHTEASQRRSKPYLSDADRAVVEHAVQQLRSAEREFFTLLGQVSDPVSARNLLEQIAVVARAAYIIGAHCAMTDTADRFFQHGRAKHMRVRRPESKWERDLTAAIEAVRGRGRSQHPYKEADTILEDVNRRLSALGHKKGISRTTLYRRLRRD